MTELFTWLSLSIFSFALFLIFLIAGFIRSNKKLLLSSLLLFLATAIFGGRAAWLFVHKSIDKMNTMTTPRTGTDIYTALFGKPVTCVQVLNWQDQVVPKIDYAIWLHVRTCPDEILRITGQKEFSLEIISTEYHSITGSGGKDWFKPETLGDSVLFLHWKKDEYGNGQYLYCARDSSELFCKDVLD